MCDAAFAEMEAASTHRFINVAFRCIINAQKFVDHVTAEVEAAEQLLGARSFPSARKPTILMFFYRPNSPCTLQVVYMCNCVKILTGFSLLVVHATMEVVKHLLFGW